MAKTSPLEFKKSFNNELSGWNSEQDGDLPKGPGLYKATLILIEDITDTFLDMSEWDKGLVIVNGFVLGKYAFIGPQQTLYLPGPFLQPGNNEIITFEHFKPAGALISPKIRLSKHLKNCQEIVCVFFLFVSNHSR